MVLLLNQFSTIDNQSQVHENKITIYIQLTKLQQIVSSAFIQLPQIYQPNRSVFCIKSYNMNRNSSVPLIPYTKSYASKQQNVQQKPIFFKNYDQLNSIKNNQPRPKLPSADHLYHKKQLSNSLSDSNAIKKLKNFIKKDQITDSYVKQFVHLKKSSFFLSNKLTKSVFDISDAAMFGKPQSLNTFRKKYDTEANISSLKNAVKNITKQKKSHIPKLYKKSFSLSSLTKKDDLNTSVEKTFFPTTALQKTLIFQDKNYIRNKSLSNKPKIKRNQPNRLTKPLSQRKIIRIDHKLGQLRQHNHSMHKLIPVPIIKPQKVIIKGKGEIVSQEKIIRVIDKLLSVLELYFQMHDENGARVYAFLKGVQGFDHQKLIDCLCEGQCVKTIKSAEDLKRYFWVFKAQQHEKNKNSQDKPFKLPEFFGEDDYALYRVFNNFVLKLQSKYENNHKQKFKKVREIAFQNKSKEFNSLYSATNQSKESQIASNKIQKGGNKKFLQEKTNPIMSISQNKHADRKGFLNKIKFNPLNSDKKISTQIEELQDLGVKFDFKQKGRSIILSERSKIIFTKR